MQTQVQAQVRVRLEAKVPGPFTTTLQEPIQSAEASPAPARFRLADSRPPEPIMQEPAPSRSLAEPFATHWLRSVACSPPHHCLSLPG